MEIVNDYLPPLPDPSMPASDWSTVETCAFAASFYWAVSGAIDLAIIRDLGHEVRHELIFRYLRRGQLANFLGGCQKLGIDRETSDAIRCAKYHALSNALGGVRMKYAIESASKAWIFYLPDTGSVAPAIAEDEFWLSMFRGWHANNSTLLGNHGLIFVATHLVSRGDPYDAGYFLDTGEELELSDRLRIHLDHEPPTAMELRYPEVDPEVWPAERRIRAFRNVKVGWTCDHATMAIAHFGEAGAACVRRGIQIALYAWLPVLLDAFAADVDPTEGAERASRIFAGVHSIAGSQWSVSIESENGGRRVAVTDDLLSGGSDALDDEHAEIGYRAMTEAWAGLARALGASISAESETSRRSWVFRDS